MQGWINPGYGSDGKTFMPAATPQPTAWRERILLYAKAKAGKTWAACSLIEEVIRRDPATTIFYVSTDNGFEPTFYAYFGNKAEDYKKHIRLYNAAALKLNRAEPFFAQVAKMFFEIRGAAKPNDYLIVDKADDFWSWAQMIWTEQSAPGNSVTSYLADAAKDLKKFMELQRSMWQLTKRWDNIATTDIIDNPPCNLLYLVGEKELEIYDEKSESEKQEADDMFKFVGAKPGGQGSLPYSFNTLVYVTGLVQKKFFVLADRGHVLDYHEHLFGREWYTEFIKQRIRQ